MWVGLCAYWDISFLPTAKGTKGTEITDTAGRMADTNLSGWIYEWLGSEGRVDGCVRVAQTMPAIPSDDTVVLKQRERDGDRRRGRYQMPRGSTIALTVLSWLYDVYSWSRKRVVATGLREHKSAALTDIVTKIHLMLCFGLKMQIRL